MSRLLLRPGWILTHLAVIAIAVTFINLGLWQLDRHGEVSTENERLEKVIDGQPSPLDQALRADDVKFLPAAAQGTYMPDEEVKLSPRSRNDRPGFDILTPLVLDDGRTLVVDRGWVPLNEVAPDPPSGSVQVTGRLRPPLPARQVLPPGGPRAELVSNVDLAVLQDQLPDLVDTAYLEVTNDQALEGGVIPRPAEPVTLDSGNHLSYAFQWFAFTLIGLVGYPLLLLRRIAEENDPPGTGPPPTGSSAGAQPDPTPQGTWVQTQQVGPNPGTLGSVTDKPK